MTSPSRQSSLNEWVDWLLHLHAQEIDLGLDRVAKVAADMELLRPAKKVISVAGTNGKGSSVAMLSAILKAAGYRVGSYTSPHIRRFNERIRINGEMVEDQVIVDVFDAIEQARKQTKLTYFEFSTLAALKVFKDQQVDVAVLEVGLGGRLDAVNIVDADAALITAIDVDHIDWLGDDRSLIALEKAGIARTGHPAVCSDPCPPDTLVNYMRQHQIPFAQIGDDFNYRQKGENWSFLFAEDSVLELPLPALKGGFQLQNAAGVLAVLRQLNLPIDKQAIINGLLSVEHEGRLQVVGVEGQNWLFDVAHNPQSAQVLAEYLQHESAGVEGGSKRVAIFSVLNDKDSLPMVCALAPYIDRWAIAELHGPRALPLQKLQSLLQQSGVSEDKQFAFDSMDDAVFWAKQQAPDPVLVWGSFFTVSQVKEALDNAE
ncbi:bifunctional tetrahydrofolate synthase/dihydrofolate synthase [Thiomicrorhabdus sp.]|uniref:bifunctional tetrahydrofolate synthase/dihydrofolate synthase n=1 Tax=Thiomicrorhabdus sp. TaxID=2039724 RepID=UPI0029C852EA|nr:bifunctional tetrahydrofolate synthase/dihydrofolate synthase [Thiomicrorhabdus sp.]